MFEKIIADYDALYPNQIPFEQKRAWLMRFEGQLKDKLLTVYAVTPAPEYIAAEPYDEVYTYYLKLKCAERNEDTERYNNALANFRDAYDELAAYYNRTFAKKTDNTRYQHVYGIL